MKRLLSASRAILTVVFCCTAASVHADAVDRLRLDRLQALNKAIEHLRSERHNVGLPSAYEDVRALLHVHSGLSHDSRGTIDEIVSAARQANVRVIMFSEHPATKYDYFLDGHRGVKDGVLLIPGAETGGFLAYPRASMKGKNSEMPQAFADEVRATGGLIFLCHLEERMDWDIARITGSEIYNTHADLKGEDRFLAAFRNPLEMVALTAAFTQYPQESFGALLDYPQDYLKRFDQLCQGTPHTGVAGNDSHHNQVYIAKILDDGNVLIEDILGTKVALLDPQKLPALKLLTAGKAPGGLIFKLDLDPYACSFRHVSTHLLLPAIDEGEVRQALVDGRAYVAFDWLADPTGFVYRAQRGSRSWPIGSELQLEKDLHLKAESPLEGRFKFVRNGETVVDKTTRSLDFLVDKPGVYRVEIWLKLPDEERPWILTNPIYIRGPQGR